MGLLAGRVLMASVAILAAPIAAMAQSAPSAYCPANGLVTIAVNGRETRSRTVWRGADPGDPQVCLVETPKGRRAGAPERKLFGRWVQSGQRYTAGEEQVFRTSVVSVLSGQTLAAQFILRENGVQVVEAWNVVGRDSIQVDGRPVQTLHIRVNNTYSANNATWYCELWFAPALKLFVKSKPSIDYLVFGADNVNRFTWDIVKIKDFE